MQGNRWNSFHFFLDGEEHIDDLGQTISYSDFYRAMSEGADTKTSQVNVDEFIQYFEPFLKEGKDILHVCLSSGITGVMNSAILARDVLEKKYPDRKILIVDSLGASSGYGLLMDHLADLRDSGMDIDSLYQWVLTHRLELHHWFFSTDLSFYVKGGRISKAAGAVGSLLSLCPLLNMNDVGELKPREKIRSKKKVISAIVDRMEQHVDNGLGYQGKCYLSHSDCIQDAEAVAKLVEDRFPEMNGKVLINNVGTTIGSHTGPGTVALFFWGDTRIP